MVLTYIVIIVTLGYVYPEPAKYLKWIYSSLNFDNTIYYLQGYLSNWKITDWKVDSAED